MEYYTELLRERLTVSEESPEQAQAIQELLQELLQAYKQAGGKGVSQHIKKQLEARQGQAVAAIQELQERL